MSDHMKWVTDIEETQGPKVTCPMSGDPELKIAKLYGMLPAERRQLRGLHGIGQWHRAHGIRRRSGQNNQAAAQLPDEYRPQRP
jgi:alkyl hydroperoxide reductase subunit AhpC